MKPLPETPPPATLDPATTIDRALGGSPARSGIDCARPAMGLAPVRHRQGRRSVRWPCRGILAARRRAGRIAARRTRLPASLRGGRSCEHRGHSV